MPELEIAIRVVEIIVAAVLMMLLGDYLGYKIGRWRLAAAKTRYSPDSRFGEGYIKI